MYIKGGQHLVKVSQDKDILSFFLFDLTFTAYNYGLKTPNPENYHIFWNPLDVLFHPTLDRSYQFTNFE